MCDHALPLINEIIVLIHLHCRRGIGKMQTTHLRDSVKESTQMYESTLRSIFVKIQHMNENGTVILWHLKTDLKNRLKEPTPNYKSLVIFS